ncbi:MAG TPA: uroporphyrinogen-III C-methyltransferase [Bryobacteraceae bacterium]|nr:uroporphyrinogen-III C-methyltransferase [Bryobacteraceae bacterium]
MTKRGKLYLIGAGPGDPELLTLKAVRVLGLADVVLYDRLISPEVLAHARPDAELVYVGKHQGEQEHKQSFIFDLIRQHAVSGKAVARLKGGDPLVFGRGAEEWALALQHGIEVELIPGVTSSISVPGLAGIPLTYRRVSQSFAVITGHCHTGAAQEWGKYAAVDTLVILMGVKNRDFIARSLIEAGRPPHQPVAFVERGSTPNARVIESDLAAVAAGDVEASNPAVFVIGDVVRLRKKLIEAPEQPGPAEQL